MRLRRSPARRSCSGIQQWSAGGDINRLLNRTDFQCHIESQLVGYSNLDTFIPKLFET
jgi:hypothetical protein